MMPPNKGMKQTRLSAAPGWPFRLTWMEVPPHALRRFAPVRTASQLIPGVRWTLGGSMIGTRAVALGVAVACGAAVAAAPKAHLTAASVHHMIDSSGPSAAVSKLFDGGNLEGALADGIGGGGSGWLRVAERLRPASDGAAGEILCMAVQEALPKNPVGVLRLVRRKAFSVEDACGNYGFGQIEDERPLPVLLGLVAIRQKAVEGVQLPQLARERAACLAALAGLDATLRSRQ
jgi:hypothetical protein